MSRPSALVANFASHRLIRRLQFDPFNNHVPYS
jgi:hypothetical protein